MGRDSIRQLLGLVSGEKLTTDLIFLGQTELALKVVPKAVKFVHSLGERSAVRLPGNPSKSTVRSPPHTYIPSRGFHFISGADYKAS